jgi:hypothetical protein
VRPGGVPVSGAGWAVLRPPAGVFFWGWAAARRRARARRRVPPGTYTIKLTASGKTLTTTVDVKLDPRVKLARAVVAKIGELEQRLADLVTRSSQLAMQAKSLTAQLAKLTPQPDPLKTQIGELSSKLAAIASEPRGPAGPSSGAPRAPTLSGVNSKLVTLYRMIDVDALPTAAQLAETAKAEQELAALAKQWDALAAGPLAQLNAAFNAAGLTAIRPATTPETTQEHGEEE